MTGTNNRDYKKIRPYALAALPFFAAFAYQLAVVWPTRPRMPDPAKGFVIQTVVDRHTVYVSSMDMALMLGTWAGEAAVIGFGLWRVFRQPRD